jgi:acid stress-induced BolA-like protein IbaG/YrbA
MMEIQPPHTPEAICAALRQAIGAALPDARVEVQAGSPGHYEIGVVSAAFAGLARVRQQQLVYAAIRHLMTGDDAPVHAIDRLHTATP